MSYRPETAEEGLLRQVERWTPADAEIWSRWLQSLGSEQRGDLLALQAVLSGLVAFRHVENHPRRGPCADLRPHVHAVRIAYDWALELVGRLEAAPPRKAPWLSPAPQGEPGSSLNMLERALGEALQVSEQIPATRVVDAAAFRVSVDPFLHKLRGNPFFWPPEPLEFSNVTELVRPRSLVPKLASWQSDAAKMSLLISLLTLLRSHRFLGIADRQIGRNQGLYRAHVVLAAVRRDLRAWSRFVLVQGVETFAEELEARLLAVDAMDIAKARTDLRNASRELRRLRESAEMVATEVDAKARAALDEPLPALEGRLGDVLVAERMRSGIRTVRVLLKEAARDLHRLASPPEEERGGRQSERVPRDLQSEIWSFRFILRAFIAKSSVSSLAADDWRDAEDLRFVGEFARHFRVFGPRLARTTEYPRFGPLTRLVGALSRPEFVDAATLERATHECVRFAEHLDAALDRIPQSPLAPFDKDRAAADLRGYLAAAKDYASRNKAAGAAFGLPEPSRLQAG